MLWDMTEDIKKKVEPSLKVIELLWVQQINTSEISYNTEKFITVKENDKSKKNKLNHQQDYRIPLKNWNSSDWRMPGQTWA